MSTDRDGTVGEVIDKRVAVYGDPTETFGRIAETWSGILGVHVNPVDVPLCLIGMKLVRTQVTPDYSDNSDDVEGYLDIFRQLVGDDMVHARTVTEYLEVKDEQDQPVPFVPVEESENLGPTIVHSDGSVCRRVKGDGRFVLVDDFAQLGLTLGSDCPHESHDMVDGGHCRTMGRHVTSARHSESECPL